MNHANSVTRSLLAAAITAALALPATQAARAQGATGLEEIVVTARRAEETLQDVPIAVSAFSAEDLRNLQAEDLSALQGAVPNLNLVQGRGSASSANIFIRGIGQPDALQTFDPGVGVYLDDVYISRIQGALFNLHDVERIEVLRGPQGTLYGKNTIAGAIKIVTRRPGPETEADIEVGIGRYNARNAKAYFAGELTDTLYGSVSGLWSERDGTVTDYLTGREYNDRDERAARVALRWVPTDTLEATLAFDTTRQRNALNLGKAEAPLISVDVSTLPPTVVLRRLPDAGEWDRTAASLLPNDPGQKLDHTGVSLTVDWDINSALRAKSITAFRNLETAFFIDIDGTELELGDVFVGVDQDQISQEFQLAWDNGGDFRAIGGVYALRETIESDQAAFADDFLLFGPIPIDFLRTIEDDLKTTSYAIFGQGTWAFAPQWSATLGMRYTYEKKDYFRSTSTFSSILGNADPAFAFDVDDSWNAFTPSLTLDYKPSDDVLLYGSIARGFKSGGFNGRANAAVDVSTFDPEYVWTYELGAKSTLADNRVRLNAAAFFSDYKDFQARISEISNPDDPIPNFGFPVLNAGKLEIWGAELEAAWVPVDALTLAAQLGYLKADYKEFRGRAAGPDGSVIIIDRSGDEPPFAPEWTARLAASYTFEFGTSGSLTLGADGAYRSKAWLSVDNQDVLTQSGYWLANAFVSWLSDDARWRVTGGVRNLTDEVYKVDAQEFTAVGNIQTAYYGDPRTWTLSLRYSF
ncbi:MAG: TonB-dependent receptor [Gammaproteobacteria bacterium]|nr:MAG: TonB-dependent receptor [Gammaproteobacteria bacterium]